MVDDTTQIKGLKFARVLVWLVYAYFILAAAMLTLAFFLLLFGANTDASFTEWVYRSSDRVLEPFRGIFPTVAHDGGSVVDFAVLFAIIMYGFLALALHALITWIDGKISAAKFELSRTGWQQGTPPGQSPPMH